MRKGLYILGDLKDTDLIWLSRSGLVQTVGKGDCLIRPGVDIADLYFITEGKFSVRIGASDVADLGVGDVMGEMSFVERRPPAALVTALTDARVLAVPRATLLEEFARNDGFAARFYRALAVFLSDRLRSMSPDDDADEIDEMLLDTLHVAGDRLLRLIQLLEGEAAA